MHLHLSHTKKNELSRIKKLSLLACSYIAAFPLARYFSAAACQKTKPDLNEVFKTYSGRGENICKVSDNPGILFSRNHFYNLFFLFKAREIFHHVQEGEATSSYSHKNEAGHKDDKPHYAFNCYGFIEYLLKNTYPKALKEVVNFMEEKRETIAPSVDGIPCPYNYLMFFESLGSRKSNCWERVHHFKDLIPGDVIVYMGPDYVHQAVQEIGSARTGTHLMVVDEVYENEVGTQRISVIDCTRSPHNRVNDTRWEGKNGIGRCSLYLSKNEGGTSIRWLKNERNKSVMMARLVDSRVYQA